MVIVVPVFNQLAYTKRCLDSLRNAGLPDSRSLVINNITGAGDSDEAIFIDSTAASFVIQGNYIGTDVTGTFAVPVSQGPE